MKVKRYEVTLTNPEAIHVASYLTYQDIKYALDALDTLWKKTLTSRIGPSRSHTTGGEVKDDA